jgi:hypothetical protein
VSANRFNPVSAPLSFKLGGATFLQDPGSVSLTVNGSPIPSDALTLEPHAITAVSALVDGENEIEFSAVDEFGRPVFLKRTLWAGSSFVTVDLSTRDGASFGDPATVRLSLVGDQSVFAEASTTSGTVDFENVPFRTIVARAAASGNRIGLTGFVGTQSRRGPHAGLEEPSPIANNDFSLGTDGWEIGSAPSRSARVEGSPPARAGARGEVRRAEGRERRPHPRHERGGRAVGVAHLRDRGGHFVRPRPLPLRHQRGPGRLLRQRVQRHLPRVDPERAGAPRPARATA